MNENPITEKMRRWAKDLYTRDQKTIAEISEDTGHAENAVRDWISKGQWERIRKSYLTVRQTQLDLLYDILSAHIDKMRMSLSPMPAEEAEITEGRSKEPKTRSDANTKDADLLIKYTAAIKNLEKEVSLTEIIEVAKLFCRWLVKRDLELGKTVTRELDAFISERKEVA